MKYYIAILLALILSSCNTVKVKDSAYKVSHSSTEIGSIGISKSTVANNEFITHVFPKLENKIRVEVSVVPFSKKMNKKYLQKAIYNQGQEKIQYADSLKSKPEMVTISILDIIGFVKEINATNNAEVINYLKDAQKARIVTSISTTLPSDVIAKIRQADSYYLINAQDNKYTLALYKATKKTETIDLQSGVVLGYKLASCCWSMNNKGKWYLADLVDENTACNGNTESKVKEKKTTKSLYRM